MPKVEWVGALRLARFKGEVGIFPVDTISIEGMRRIGKIGTEALVSTRTARNIKQHRLAWALARKLVECVDTLHDDEDAMDYLKKKARHGHFYVDPLTGEAEFRVGSIAFASLSQEKFGAVFDRFVKVICEEIVPGLDEGDLKREVIEMCEGEWGRRFGR